MTRRIRRAMALAAAGLLVILAGCTGNDIPQRPVPLDDPGTPEETAPAEEDPPAGEEDLPAATEHDDERVLVAAGDLAERTDGEPGQVQVVEFQSVTWPDGSIGCPEEGMFYTQALVNGYLLVLQADGAHYRYHAAGDQPFAYCENPEDPVHGGGEHR